MNFIPTGFGKYILPNRSDPSTPQEFKVLTKAGTPQAFKSCIPDSLTEIIESRRIRIDFLNKGYYDGEINENLDFEGIGYIGTDDEGYWGVFTPGELMTFVFVKSHQPTIEFLKTVTGEYFKDSEKYRKEHLPNMKQYPWMKLHGAYHPFLSLPKDHEVRKKAEESLPYEYKGAWKDYNPVGKCWVRKQDVQFEGIVNDKCVMRIKELSMFSMSKYLMNKSRKQEFSCEYVDGTKYSGQFSFGIRESGPSPERKFGDFPHIGPNGIGTLTLPDGRVFSGVWNLGKLIFDLSLVDQTKFKFDLEMLNDGIQKVEYKNGFVYEGKFKDYGWSEDGEIVKNYGTPNETRERWDPEKIYLSSKNKDINVMEINYCLVLWPFIMTASGMVTGNNIEGMAVKMMREYQEVEDDENKGFIGQMKNLGMLKEGLRTRKTRISGHISRENVRIPYSLQKTKPEELTYKSAPNPLDGGIYHYYPFTLNLESTYL